MASPTHEGEEQDCHCGTHLTARIKPAEGGYPEKLRWENPDGGAHYKSIGNGKFSCNTGKTTVNTPSVGPKETNVAANIPVVAADKTIDEATNVVLKAFRAADEQVKVIYVGLNPASNTYGQIRRCFQEDIVRVYCALITKPKL